MKNKITPIIGETIYTKEEDIKVIIIDKDDNTQKALISNDIINKTDSYWIDYDELWLKVPKNQIYETLKNLADEFQNKK